MTKLLTIVISLLIIYNATSQEQKQNIQKTIKTEAFKDNNGLTINDEAYTLFLEIEETNDGNPTLVISIELHQGSYYISPYDRGNNKGKFYMDFGSYENLAFKNDIIENRHSFKEIETQQNSDEIVNWVRVNTTYKQKLEVKSLNDFEVFGRLKFTIEPRCSLEVIPFTISYKNGVYKIVNSKC